MKLYLVTRADLPPGPQAVQVAHAALEYALTYPGLKEHPPFAVLVARDEDHLEKLAAATVIETDFKPENGFVHIREPDLGGALTAFAAHGPRVGNVLRKLPMLGAGRGPVLSSARHGPAMANDGPGRLVVPRWAEQLPSLNQGEQHRIEVGPNGWREVK